MSLAIKPINRKTFATDDDGLLLVCLPDPSHRTAYAQTLSQDETKQMNGLAERTYAEWKAQNVTASAEYTAITVVAKRLSSTVAITQISTYSTEVSILAQPLTTQVSLQPNESQRNADGSEQLREAGVVAQSSFVKGAAHSKQRPGKISEMNVTLPVSPNANQLAVTIKLFGARANQSYATVVTLKENLSSAVVGLTKSK